MPDPIRRTALSILNRQEQSQHTLDGVMDAAIEKRSLSSRRDRNFIFALTYGTLRWRGRLDWVLDQVSRTPIRKIDPHVRNILRMGLFQILFMDREDILNLYTVSNLPLPEGAIPKTGTYSNDEIPF